MATPPVEQPLFLPRGVDATITVTMRPAESISGWTFILTIRDTPESLLTTIYSTTSITTVSSSSGIFTFAIPAATTAALTPGLYAYDIWRTNSGSLDRLAYGPLTIQPQVRLIGL